MATNQTALDLLSTVAGNPAANNAAAYGFLTAVNNSDQHFLHQTINQGQQFFSASVNPITDNINQAVNSTADKLAFNNASAFSQFQNTLGFLADNVQSAAGNAIVNINQISANSNKTSANAATQSATAAASSGGGSFITTAITYNEARPDRRMLDALINFRDEFVSKDKGRKKLLIKYYRNAPEIVRRIKACEYADEIFCYLKKCYLEKAYFEFQNGRLHEAFEIYTAMVLDAALIVDLEIEGF